MKSDCFIQCPSVQRNLCNPVQVRSDKFMDYPSLFLLLQHYPCKLTEMPAGTIGKPGPKGTIERQQKRVLPFRPLGAVGWPCKWRGWAAGGHLEVVVPAQGWSCPWGTSIISAFLQRTNRHKGARLLRLHSWAWDPSQSPPRLEALIAAETPSSMMVWLRSCFSKVRPPAVVSPRYGPTDPALWFCPARMPCGISSSYDCTLCTSG